MNKTVNIAAYAVAVVTVLVWGETFISSKFVLSQGVRPADLFFYRFAIAYAGMLLFSHKKFYCGNIRDELVMLGLGLSGGSLYFLTENTAIAYTTASNVAIIISATPLATAFIMSLFYEDEKMNASQIAGSVVSIIGLALIIFNGRFILHLNPAGDLLALSAVLCWGLYSLLMKKLSAGYDLAFINRKIFGYGLLTIIPYFLIKGWPELNTEVLLRPAVSGNILYLGLIASWACYFSWSWSLKKLGTVRATNLIYFQPFFALIISAVFLGERITWAAVLGSVVLMIGMIMVQRFGIVNTKPH